jgi:hypothetical protein
MFRAVLPRASPRAALRNAGPKAVPSTFIATPMLLVRGSKRGYASEAGELLLGLLPRRPRRDPLRFPDAIADFRVAGQ